MKTIMSIDPGLRSMGIYIYNSNGLEIFTTIKTSIKDSTKECYCKINCILKELINQYNIEIILLEDYAYSQFSRSISSLAEIKGLIKNIAYENEITILMISISTWKSLHKNLNLPKNKNKQYLKIINKHFNRCFMTCDEADAFLILTAVYYISNGIIRSKPQLKLKEKIEELKIF